MDTSFFFSLVGVLLVLIVTALGSWYAGKNDERQWWQHPYIKAGLLFAVAISISQLGEHKIGLAALTHYWYIAVLGLLLGLLFPCCGAHTCHNNGFLDRHPGLMRIVQYGTLLTIFAHSFIEGDAVREAAVSVGFMVILLLHKSMDGYDAGILSIRLKSRTSRWLQTAIIIASPLGFFLLKPHFFEEIHWLHTALFLYVVLFNIGSAIRLVYHHMQDIRDHRSGKAHLH